MAINGPKAFRPNLISQLNGVLFSRHFPIPDHPIVLIEINELRISFIGNFFHDYPAVGPIISFPITFYPLVSLHFPSLLCLQYFRIDASVYACKDLSDKSWSVL